MDEQQPSTSHSREDFPTTDKHHMEKLNEICRICGKVMKKSIQKIKFADEFKGLFEIDVKKEDPQIFPAYMCAMHGAMFYRFRTALRNNAPYSTDFLPPTFEMHSDHCQVCKNTSVLDKDVTERSRWNPPGRGKRCATYIQPKNLDTKKIKISDNTLYEQYKMIHPDECRDALSSFIKTLTIQEKMHVIKSIFEEENNDINQKIECTQSTFDSISSLNELDIKVYLDSHNSVLLQTVLFVSQASIEKDSYRLAILLENIYKLRNANFLGPVSTLQNLTVLSLTNSKAAVDICGSSGAGGRYMTLCKWLGNIPSEANISPAGDILLVFDNEQIIGKTWNIKPNNKIKTSIITTVASIQLQNEKYSLQKDHQFHPASWFTKDRVNDVMNQVILEESEVYNTYKKEHYSQFKLFVTASIAQILDESVGKEMDIIDQIVTNCKQRRDLKTCPGCNNFFPKSKRKCPQCKIDLMKLPDTVTQNHDNQQKKVEVTPLNKKKDKSKADDDHIDSFRFGHVEHFHQTSEIPVFVMDPVFVNPNSIDNLKLVLRHLGKTAGIKRYGGEERDWVIVCCDGLPYTMVCRMIEEYFTCIICNKGFLGKEAFDSHKKEHPDVQEVKFVREFDWILLKTGDGHYEMNLMKSFVELNWDVFMRILVNRMGWTSEAAMKAAKMCYDNHKTWQLILTFHLGTLQELILPYVRKCLIETDENTLTESPTASGFLQFVKSMEHNPNYIYLFDMVSRYSQAIVNFRMGIRRNNTILVQSSKFMSKGLFHGRVHPRYQQIEMLDTVHRFLMPEQLQTFLSNHESMSKTGDESKGQGYDFILEEVNKGIKSWIRRGVASDNMWLSVCRNYDQLNEIRTKLKKILQLDTDNFNTRKINLDEAISDWRVCLREKEYLLKEKYIHESLQGEKLNEGLLKFTEEANRKRNYRLMEFFIHQEGPDDPTLKHPVFVTDSEADHYLSFHNQTIATIDHQIIDLIENFTDEDKKVAYQDRFKKEILRKKKSVHIEFFAELLEVINDQDLVVQDEDGDQEED
ncbi:uncharacterized protein [Mytilus edulis]|uniref:uncharacterized protein isoform X2 n=1 Tax=Mytilus edulis TaxID=6550 RepID=UPI0039EF3D6A